MSRGSAGDTQIVKASVNVYTALTGVALVAAVTALVIVFLTAKSLFGSNLFS